MPEGPELHLASLYVNRVCDGVVFTGSVRKSEVSKRPDVPFTCDAYRIMATSRGKEVKLTLTPIKSDDKQCIVKEGQADQTMDIAFRFGMSGCFRFTTEDELPKHAHLRFYSNEKPCRVLSYVDARRFGSWQPNGTWQPNRGPCIMVEYKSFRKNVLSHLSDRAFDRPICEALLNQKYFNGIGNYLRAEILFRLNIPPFVQARSVLQGLEPEHLSEDEVTVKEELAVEKSPNRAKKDKVPPADLLSLCHTVPVEVVNMGGKGYDPQRTDCSDFEAWLQCYYVDGMKSIRDHNGRTMWFSGDPGPMAPKDSVSERTKKKFKKEVVGVCSKNTKTEKGVHQEATTKKLKAKPQNEIDTRKQNLLLQPSKKQSGRARRQPRK